MSDIKINGPRGQGPRGHRGPRGNRGHRGLDGSTGPTGQAGQEFGPSNGFLPAGNDGAPIVLAAGDNVDVNLPALGFPGLMRFSFTSPIGARLSSIATAGTTIEPGNMILLENANPSTGAPIVVSGTGPGSPGNRFSGELILNHGTAAWFVYDGVTWLPTSSVLGSPVFPVLPFVFLPGGVASANVYNDWSLLMAAVGLVSGLRIIQIDDTIVSPAVIPAGTWDLQNVILRGLLFRPTFARFADGAVLTNARQFDGNLVMESVSTSPVISDLGNGELIIAERGTVFGSTTAPLIRTSALTAGQSAQIVLRDGSRFVNGGVPVLDVPIVNTAIGLIAIGAFSEVNSNTISGVVGSQVQLVTNVNVPIGFVSVDQPAFLGQLVFIVQPARYNIDLTVATSNTGAGVGAVLRLNPTAGGFNVTLPPAFNNAGEQIILKNITASANAVTILPTGADTIDGAPSQMMAGARATNTYISDGISDWLLVASW